MSFAEIRRENGYPALYIDGLRMPPILSFAFWAGARAHSPKAT